MPKNNNNNLQHKGAWLAVLSGLLYGLLGYFGMILLRSGMSASNVSFWRFLVSFLSLLLMTFILAKKVNVRHLWHWSPFMIGAIFYSGPSILFFMASKYIGTGQAMVIFFSFPAFVMILNRIFYAEPIKSIYFISFAIIISGLVLLIDIGELSLDLVGISLSLLSAISYACYVIFSKNIKASPLQSTLMVSLGCAVTSLVIALLSSSFQIPTNIEQWFNIMGIALICTGIPILLMLKALKYISSAEASLLSVLEPVFTVIFGVFLLDETITSKALFGVVITLFGAITVSLRTANASK